MRTTVTGLSVAATLVSAGLSAFGAEKAAAVEVKALFEQKCSICHSVDRPKSKRKTAADWRTTVMRMKNVHGCPITDAQAELIIGYLAKRYGVPESR